MAQLLERMATRHHVALLYLRAPTDPPLDPSLQEQVELVEEVTRPDPGFSLAELRSRLNSAIHFKPMWVIGSSVSAYKKRVRAIARAWRPDVVQIDYHVMGQYLSALDGCPAPRVLTEHEPGISAARDRWQSGRGLSRAMHYIDLRAWERFERTITKHVQAVVVFTERDRQALAQLAHPTPVVTIPIGAVLPEQPLDPIGDESLTLLFVGNFIHPPNADAAARLVNVIFPRLQAHIPGVHLHVVGDLPTAQIRELANETVVVTGCVPDVTPYLDRAAVVVAPLRMGGGMRVKVLEALASGKAVVASPLAVEGLDVVDGKHVLLAESDQEFVEAVVHLLRDPVKRVSLAVSARAWAIANLGWERSIEAYERLYRTLLTAGDRAARPLAI
jgi:polysaccharide biosynthesis protein PslH